MPVRISHSAEDFLREIFRNLKGNRLVPVDVQLSRTPIATTSFNSATVQYAAPSSSKLIIEFQVVPDASALPSEIENLLIEACASQIKLPATVVKALLVKAIESSDGELLKVSSIEAAQAEKKKLIISRGELLDDYIVTTD